MFKKMMLGLMAVAFLSATSTAAFASGSMDTSQKSNDSSHIMLVKMLVQPERTK